MGKTVVVFRKVVTAMVWTPLMTTALKIKYVQVLLVKSVAVVLKSSQGQVMIRQTRFQNPQDMCYGLTGILKS